MICSITEHSKIAISTLLPSCNCFLTPPASCKTSDQYVEDLQLQKPPQKKSPKSKHITKLLQLRNSTKKSITSQNQQQQHHHKDFNKIVISTRLKFWSWKKEQTKLIFYFQKLNLLQQSWGTSCNYFFGLRLALSLLQLLDYEEGKMCKIIAKKKKRQRRSSKRVHGATLFVGFGCMALVCAFSAGFCAMIKTEVREETDHQHAINGNINFITLLLLYYHCLMRKSGSAKSATRTA